MVTQDSPVECSRRVFLDLFQFLVATGYIAPTSASILTQASLPSTLLSLLQTLEVLLSTKPPFPNNVTSTPSAWSWGVLGGEGSTFKPLHGQTELFSKVEGAFQGMFLLLSPEGSGL